MWRGRNRSNEIPKMTVDSANKKTCPPRPTVRSETKYREAVELYGSTGLSCREICRICGLTPSGLSGHIGKYHRHLMLARYDIACDSEQALHIKMGGLRGSVPLPEPNTGKRSRHANAWNISKRTSRSSPAVSAWTVRGSPASCGRIIRECSSGARRNACA